MLSFKIFVCSYTRLLVGYNIFCDLFLMSQTAGSLHSKIKVHFQSTFIIPCSAAEIPVVFSPFFGYYVNDVLLGRLVSI